MKYGALRLEAGDHQSEGIRLYVSAGYGRIEPFVLAEGLLSEKSRGDRTAIELLVAEVRGWTAGLRRFFYDGARSSR